MIRINLLDSVTEKSRGMAAIESQVSNPRTKMLLVMLSVLGLMLAGMGLDWASALAGYASAQTELKSQQEIAKQMAAINKEQSELESKTKDVQTRIDVIKRLRASQKGPVAVLSSINERLPRLSNFHLTSIEQKGEELTVMGNSPNEAAVTSFGRSLEFSAGLFTNVNIETQRKYVEAAKVAEAVRAEGGARGEKTERTPETVLFTIKCKYTQPGQAAAPQPEAQQRAAARPEEGRRKKKGEGEGEGDGLLVAQGRN